jgi:hypothetical protein
VFVKQIPHHLANGAVIVDDENGGRIALFWANERLLHAGRRG